MNTLEAHGKSKAAILKWYGRVVGELAADLLVDAKNSLFSAESLLESADNLRKDRFVVAVCGQMKAGKSTLLNALLFDRVVLPTAATTMTAKIVLMRGAAEEKLQATLYTRDEFENVVKAAGVDELSRRELALAREQARRAGIDERTILSSPARFETRSSLDRLLEFCAVPDEGGTLTPYVRSVELWADNAWLYQVDVADTPGTNDPNPERDRITREWISRADAVVFVTYAGMAGMDATDVAFMDNYLMHLHPDKRIIVVNKCDLVESQDSVRHHLRSLANSHSPRLRAMFEDHARVLLVSGLGALIDGARRTGRQLPHSETEQGRELDANGWTRPERHGMDALRREIESRVLATRGTGMIAGHRARIEAVFEHARRTFESLHAEAIGNAKAANATHEQRAAEIQQIKDMLGRVDALVKKAFRETDESIYDAWAACSDQLVTCEDALLRNVLDSLAASPSTAGMAAQVPWTIASCVRRRRSELRGILDQIVGSAESSLDKFEVEIAEQLVKEDVREYQPANPYLCIQPNDQLRSIESQLEKNLAVDAFAEIISNSTSLFQEVADHFFVEDGKIRLIHALEPRIGRVIHEVLERVYDSARSQLSAEVGKAREVIQESVAAILIRRQQALKEMQSAGERLVEKAQEHVANADEAARRLRQVNQLREEFLLEASQP